MNTQLVGQCIGILQNSANTTRCSQQTITETWQADTDIQSLLAEMLKVLNLEFRQYHNLLDLLHDQRNCFSSGDIESFERIGKQQETTVLKIKMLEEARKHIVSRLAHYYGISSDECMLAKLTKLVDGPYSRQISQCRNEAQSILEQLETARDSNAYLIRHTLHYITGVLKIFASPSACGAESGPELRKE
jgi:hypothetical protein